MSRETGIQSPRNPVVGRFYMVPCVLFDDYEGQRWIPVLPPGHSDPDLGFPDQHWHKDYRFFDDRELQSGGGSRELLFVLLERYVTIGPFLRRRKCRREMATWLDYRRYLDDPEKRYLAERFRAFHARYRGCKVGGVCPHKGIPLSAMPVVDGVAICPGHGLRISVAEGVVL